MSYLYLDSQRYPNVLIICYGVFDHSEAPVRRNPVLVTNYSGVSQRQNQMHGAE